MKTVDEIKNKIFNGDSLSVLKTFPSNSIDLVVTSPPYYNLRNYKNDQIWDADPNCNHNWKSTVRKGISGGKGIKSSLVHSKGKDNFQIVEDQEQSFCNNCNAWRGQLGSEPTPQLYIKHLIDIFRECKRVLKKTGAIWVNISDSYNSNIGEFTTPGPLSEAKNRREYAKSATDGINKNRIIKSIQQKSLLGIPERLTIAMQDELGLVRRNTIIWHKPSCMPSSAKDRFTIDFEYFYFFTKSPKYYFDTQYEPMKIESLLREGRAVGNDTKYYKEFGQGINAPRLNISNNIKQFEYNGKAIKDYTGNGVQDPSDTKRRILESMRKRQVRFGGNKYNDPDQMFKPDGTNYKGNIWEPNENLERIKRTVWSINTPNSIENHFATYPEQLIDIPIKACCPKEICNRCQLPRTKIMEFSGQYHEFGSGKMPSLEHLANKKYANLDTSNYKDSLDKSGILTKRVKIFNETGLSSCNCNVGFHPGIVLDPFLGSGTSAIKAQKLGRSYVGIELNKDYYNITKRRLNNMITSYIVRE